MPAEWITRPSREEITTLQRHFTYVNEPGCGFMFDVDAHGHVVTSNDAARENYARALAATEAGTMNDHGNVEFTSDWWNPGTIRCGCGQPLHLSGTDTTACPCGNEYSSSAQLLRANWREFCRETGELTDDLDD